MQVEIFYVNGRTCAKYLNPHMMIIALCLFD